MNQAQGLLPVLNSEPTSALLSPAGCGPRGENRVTELVRRVQQSSCSCRQPSLHCEPCFLFSPFPADARVTELSVQTTVEYGAGPRPVLGSVEAQALGPGL